MELKSLCEVINFSLGKNPTRIKEQELSLYSPENFESDLYCINVSLISLSQKWHRCRWIMQINVLHPIF